MKIRVLFLAADPSNLPELGLKREVAQIDQYLQASDFGDQIEIVPHWSTKPDDLIQLLNEDDDWEIVHFSGHGSEAHQLLFVDDFGNSKPVGKEALQRLFGSLGRKARVAIFNACFAEGQAEAVTQHIDCAIGMSKAIGDEAAIRFAASFYRGIGFGKSVQDAFDQGRLSIDLEGIPESETPQLLCRPGFDPGSLVFLSSTERYQVEDELTKLAPPPPDLKAGQSWHLFLSYRSVNRPWILNLYDVLQRHGYDIFLDQFAIQPGTPLVLRLEEGLQKSRTGILVWSTANTDSEWCMNEYQTMVQRKVDDPEFTFVTLRLGGELPATARNNVWIDFSDHPDGPNGGGLLRLLFALAEKPLSPDAGRLSAALDEESRQAQLAIEAATQNGNRDALIELFGNGGLAWRTSAILGGKVAEALTKLGAYDEAVAMLDQVQTSFPRTVRPRQLKALALARRGDETKGDLEDAQRILAMLRAEGHQDPETLGIYARTWMDRYAKSGKKVHLRQSRKLYAEAFERAPDDTYTGINAAAKSVLLGEIDEGRAYARRVLEVLMRSPPVDYWQRATLAEAHLILGNYEKAGSEYDNAILEASEEKGSLASTKAQADRLRVALQVSDEDWRPIIEVFEEI